MQKVKLPKTLDPVRAALQRFEYEGCYEINDLKRLAQSCVSVDRVANVKISFKIDPLGLRYFEGQVSCSVTLECQRCEKTFEKAISADFAYTPVKEVKAQHELDDGEEELPDAYDPIEFGSSGEISLLSVVEDELILQLPNVPKHESEDCPASSNQMSWGEIDDEDDKPNPFGLLDQLKNQFKK